jgi:hypothetical protein
MKKIQLTQGKFALVDDEDYDRVMQSGLKWRVSHKKGGHVYYVVRNRKNSFPSRGNVSLHEEILGKRIGYVIDHINGNGLDNRKSNLRHVTNAQNISNRTHINRNSTTKFLGVCPNSRIYGGRYRAYCALGGKQKHLGFFDTVDEACKAYKDHKEKCVGFH